ncbi:hypothetical protein [Paenibacillus nasutitermitis]|uniref:Uncharacterized protein n=1 Tax=Paenibacillus nasutitermitis TaxID=1652958 RepID=A0A917E326_9BACL|nr:hypothetical protein [Paenibacillus nasutitermitis]GGD96790.1 hypothetical protein GCM10010911_64450 [Paenibacillus nasutitermitis]
MMMTKLAVEWKNKGIQGRVDVSGGTINSLQPANGAEGGTASIDGVFNLSASSRLLLTVESDGDGQSAPAIVMLDTEANPFSFFLRDVNKQYPIYIPAYEAIVTTADDSRTYGEIEQSIRESGLLSNLQQIESEAEEGYEDAARHTRDNPGQTWLGLSRDMRIFGVGFRGIGGEERLWDWVQPRFHGMETTLPENDDQPVRYRYLLGRGIGCVDDIKRRLEEGILPILHTTITDDDILYQGTSFVSYEHSKLSRQSLRGTHYLVADGYGHGHMLTPEQEEQRTGLLPEELEQAEETVLYFRCEATNTAKVPRYAWFKNVVPNAYVMNNTTNYSFDGQEGFVSFSEDRVCTVSKLNGKPLAQEETAILIKPGESAVFEFYLPHRPISRERAKRLISQSFGERLQECRDFWHEKLSRATQIRLPEPRVEEMMKAGLLHLELVAYGLEQEGTIVPTIGVYTAIGSESSPIVQFMDSMGQAETAKRSLMFFLDKQHEDGFIQNFGGYMLETGAALWSIGEHYRYTRDEQWIAEIKPKLLKAYTYIVAWRERNLKEELRGKGYGMLEGKTADPEDPFHSFMLNGYAYIGLSRLAELLEATDPQASASIRETAEALKLDIRTQFLSSIARSPVVPLGDGSWVPTAPPWVEHRGPLSLYAESARWLTHGSFVARDSLLGPLYLALQEVIQPGDRETGFLLNFHNELMCTRNVAFSQPYYSIHPWVHLKRGEVKPFLKAYYNGFSGLADRETHSFWEHFFQASPHKTHEEGWFLMQTRWMLYMEEGILLKLLPGIPRKWLEHGKVIELSNAASYFGPISLRVESRLEQGEIVATVGTDSDRRPASVTVRLPHPKGRIPVNVSGGIYAPQEETVRIDNFTGSAQIRLQF